MKNMSRPSAPMTASFVEDLKKALGPAQVLSDPASLLLYSYDGALDKNLPAAVVLPRGAEDVAAAVNLARARGVPYAARGAGTNLCGASVPAEGGLVIHLARMGRILSVDPDRRRAVVEPGVVNLHLNRALAPRGLMYAPDPASQKACTLGGNVGTNAGGPHCLKYGVTTHHVLGLEAVLPDGTLLKTSVDAGGYDLTALLVGAEGTLGVVTKIEANLLPLPRDVRTMLVSFPSLEAAAQTVTDVMAAGVVPATLEFMDRLTLQAVEAFCRAGYPTDAEAVLLVETDGDADRAGADMARVQDLCRKNGGRDLRVARDEAERQRLWEGRRGSYPAMARLAPNVLVEDGVVPRTRLPEAVRRIRAIAAREKLTMGLIAHAGDGNLHPNIAFDERDAAATARVRAAGQEMMRVCVELGGSISGEHGIGTDKREAMRWLFDRPTLDLFRRVKSSLDPEGLCNPGKMVPAPGADTPPAAPPPDRAAIRHDKENFTVTAGADVPAPRLAEALAAAGQYAALAGDGTVGEILSAGAVEGVRLRDHLMAVRAELAGGGVVSVGAPVMKSVAGYDLAKLFIGARGTLGTPLEATFKTLPAPAGARPARRPSDPSAFAGAVPRKLQEAFHG
jgi:glycolate oxidase